MPTMTKIDLPVRVSTGALQVGNDWPGVFIRGDEALALASDIEGCLNAFLDSDPALVKKMLMGRVVEILRSCDVRSAA
jgi:hypothetical protein